MADASAMPQPEKETPEEKNAAAVAPCPWPAAVEDRYERREKLGQGMFGDVYKAWDRLDKRFVAVKRLSARTGGGFVETSLREFAREAMCLSACRGHPSIVEFLAMYADGGRGDGDCVLVTEYAGPINLRQYIHARHLNEQPFKEDEVREAMRQLLAGARHAHSMGVVHRDIVPENVVVNRDGRGRMVYKICGFGMSEPPAEKKDDYGQLASPSPYRAPELFLGSKDYDGRVDTWSLGCIMAELLSGTATPFFGGDLDKEVFDKMLKVVGPKGIVNWRGLERVATPDRAARMRKTCRRESVRAQLREEFPSEVLSPAGFKLLKGLLHSSPDRRLTAAAALRMPWFRRPCFIGCCFMPLGVKVEASLLRCNAAPDR